MISSSKNLIRTLHGEKTGRIPFWFMRQAGRFLPEYRELRKQTKNFLEFCYTPDKATEATLQPIHRFGMDAAIIFSDILVVPHALGMEVWFEEGKGPMLIPVRTTEELAGLNIHGMIEKLAPVYEALRLTKKKLPAETALIGFAGAPWTLACYAIEGRSGSDFAQIKKQSVEDTIFFAEMIDLFTDAVILHAKEQIKAGAEIIQLFDSWAGLLNEEAFTRWSVKPAKKIVAAIKSEYPHVPVIAFPRQAGSKFLSYALEVKPNAISFDNSVPLEWVREHLQPKIVVQGNLSPEILAGDKTILLKEAEKIIAQLSDKAFVFNLGHGILPHTPVENMQALCDFLKNSS